MSEYIKGLFDSHAHLNDAKILEKFSSVDEAVEASRKCGVEYIINISTDPKTSEESLSLAHTYPFVYAACGIYPTDAQYLYGSLDSSLEEIERMLGDERCVALGEIGLDYHYDDTDREKQKYAFEKQMALAEKTGKPVVIHDREAHGDVFDIIRKFPSVKGVFHSFSGSEEFALQLVRLGWYISFSGPVTYKNASSLKAAAAKVPLERILVETDSPYLPPVPHRGEVNYPGLVALTASAIAQIRGIDEEEFAHAASENAKRLFNIK